MAFKEYNPKDVRVMFGGVELEGFQDYTVERKSLAGAYSYTTEEIREAREVWERTYPAMAEYRDQLAAKVRELTRPVQPFTLDLRGFQIRSARATVFRRPSRNSEGLRTEDFVGQADALALEWVCLVVLSITDPEDGAQELTMVETMPYHPDDLTDPSRQRRLRQWAEHQVRQAVLHEVAECLRIDGELARNPHPEVPDYPARRERLLQRQDRRGTVEFVIDDPWTREPPRDAVRDFADSLLARLTPQEGGSDDE